MVHKDEPEPFGGLPFVLTASTTLLNRKDDIPWRKSHGIHVVAWLRTWRPTGFLLAWTMLACQGLPEMRGEKHAVDDGSGGGSPTGENSRLTNNRCDGRARRGSGLVR